MSPQKPTVIDEIIYELINVYMKKYFNNRWNKDTPKNQCFKLDAIKDFKRMWDDPNLSIIDKAKPVQSCIKIFCQSEENNFKTVIEENGEEIFKDFNNLFDMIDQKDESAEDQIKHIVNDDLKMKTRSNNGCQIVSIFLWLKYPDKYFIYNYYNLKNLWDIIYDFDFGINEDSFKHLDRAYYLYNDFVEKLKNLTLTDQQLSMIENQYISLANDIEYFWSENINKTEADQIKNKIKAKNKIETKSETNDTNTNDQGKSISLNSGNFILYGIPGCGKSYKIKKMLKEHSISTDSPQVERTVFYPDYTYSDFIGCILPSRDNSGNLEYKFTPGPFTKILKRAINNINNFNEPTQQYYMIIEELNRGNAPAIFGDLFQLLDRDEKGKSEYQITNADISEYIFESESKDGEKKIYLPENFAIYATMNTADQNIFKMDTAFQRRWSMRLIVNPIDSQGNIITENDEDAIKIKNMCDTIIPCTHFTWGTFINVVNERIAKLNRGSLSMEDKRIGVFFINKYELLEKSLYPPFVHKVLKYLWDDVFKSVRGKDSIFNDNITTFEQIVEYATINSNYLEQILNNDTYKDLEKLQKKENYQ